MEKKLGGNTTNNVPMLQIGDKFYCQSLAISRNVGRMGGIKDVRIESYKSVVGWGATKEDAEHFEKDGVPLRLANMER